MKIRTRRAAIAVGAVSAAALVVAGGLALSPAQAQQVSETIVKFMAVVNCNSFNPCAGGRNSNAGFGVIATSAKGNGLDASTKNPSKSRAGRSGVYGHDDSTDGGTNNVGVAGSSTNGFGMQATSTNNIGVNSTGGQVGVLGTSPAVGIEGQNDSGGGIGVYGVSGSGGIGVYGVSDSSNALLGSVSFGDLNPVLEVDAGTADSSGAAIKALDSDGSPIFLVDDAGNVFITGHIYTKGFCSTGCSRTRRVTEYAPRESEPTMEDIGEGRLVSGKAYVALDPAFANVIDRGATYVVFVSPEGSSQGLFVTQKTARGFEVMENLSGHSTIPFGYRIVAKPYGVAAARLPMTVQAQMPMRVRPRGPQQMPRRPSV